MKVKIKKLRPNAIIPTYAKPGDAGMDLYSIDAAWEGPLVTYYTGLSMEIPEGYVGLLFPRSSVYKTGQRLTNSVGVIDSGYRGEIMIKYTRGEDVVNQNNINSSMSFEEYEPGDRVGQLIIMPYPNIEFEETEELSLTSRGSGGYGSTGK